jgi:hypothetical protein
MKSVKTFLLATIFVAALQSIACAENSEQLEILNDTGQTIESLYIAPIGNTNWGKDFAKESPFEARQNRIIKYNPAIHYFKLKMILDNGREIIWEDDKKIDFTRAWRIVLYYGKRDVLKYAIYRSPVDKSKSKKKA